MWCAIRITLFGLLVHAWADILGGSKKYKRPMKKDDGRALSKKKKKKKKIRGDFLSTHAHTRVTFFIILFHWCDVVFRLPEDIYRTLDDVASNARDEAPPRRGRSQEDRGRVRIVVGRRRRRRFREAFTEKHSLRCHVS